MCGKQIVTCFLFKVHIYAESLWTALVAWRYTCRTGRKVCKTVEANDEIESETVCWPCAFFVLISKRHFGTTILDWLRVKIIVTFMKLDFVITTGKPFWPCKNHLLFYVKYSLILILLDLYSAIAWLGPKSRALYKYRLYLLDHNYMFYIDNYNYFATVIL